MTDTVNVMKEIRAMKKLHKFMFTAIPFLSCVIGLAALKSIINSGAGEAAAVGAGIFGIVILVLCMFILLGFKLRR